MNMVQKALLFGKMIFSREEAEYWAVPFKEGDAKAQILTELYELQDGTQVLVQRLNKVGPTGVVLTSHLETLAVGDEGRGKVEMEGYYGPEGSNSCPAK